MNSLNGRMRAKKLKAWRAPWNCAERREFPPPVQPRATALHEDPRGALGSRVAHTRLAAAQPRHPPLSLPEQRVHVATRRLRVRVRVIGLGL